MDKPDVDFIDGLSPAISIDQKTASRNPRSTVGTVTEVHDYLRLLYARIGIAHCPNDGTRVERQTPQQIVDRILELEDETRFQILAPVVRGRKGEYEGLLSDLAKQGFSRARIDGEIRDLSDDIRLDRYYQHTIEVVIDRLVRRDGIEQRLTQSLETALALAEGVADIEVTDGPTLTFSQHLACSECGLSFEDLQPRNFSFNSPYGACPECSGIGTRYQVDADLVIGDPSLSLREGAIPMWASNRMRYYHRLLGGLAEVFGFSMDTPWEELDVDIQNKILHGTGDERITVEYTNRFGRKRKWDAKFEGAIPFLNRRHESAESDGAREYYQEYMAQVPCDACNGGRLNPISLAVTIDGRNIAEVSDLSLGDAHDFFDALELSERDATIAERVLKEVRARIKFLLDVGLDYLTLSRSAATLAGGEAQRIRLATQIGSGLVGVLYILDEPSIGLHQRDNQRLIETLLRLRDLGNTLIVVEHDEETIRIADHIVDIGPGAGEHGGSIVAEGPLKTIVSSRDSVTGDYLAGRRQIEVPLLRRQGSGEVDRGSGRFREQSPGSRRDIPAWSVHSCHWCVR